MVDRFDRVALPACSLQNINEVIAERVRNAGQLAFPFRGNLRLDDSVDSRFDILGDRFILNDYPCIVKNFPATVGWQMRLLSAS